MDNQAVATHYNERRDEGRRGRQGSRIINLRRYNNWVKSVLINLHTRPGYAVLDLCCGKGGDWQKWVAARCSSCVACDTAEVSVKTAAERYNGLSRPTFRPRLMVGDCFAVPLVTYLADDAMFDIVSCQFAMHYALESEERTRMLLRNVTERLRPGGFFIGTTMDANVLVRKVRAIDGLQIGSEIFAVKFDDRFAEKRFPRDQPYGIRYSFTLDQNVEDCPEYLVHFPSFEKLALEYDLELLLLCNFHDFFNEFSGEDYAEFRDLLFSMRVIDDFGAICMSVEEWDAAYLYTAFAFRKKGGETYHGLSADEVPGRQWPPIPEDEIVMMSAPAPQG